ncbi:hypothetical protein ACFP3I_05090 [Chryseobacterium arachidis]|uniref:hypothetical protein n=1 Tax=Chryseobacterium arachidis TaxID=1416778 RepID=UPI00360898B9
MFEQLNPSSTPAFLFRFAPQKELRSSRAARFSIKTNFTLKDNMGHSLDLEF